MLFLTALSVGGVILYSVHKSMVTGGASPEIHFDKEEIEVQTGTGDEALLEGVTATDPEDGDVTDSVMVVAEIGYPETDVSANFASAMLKANYLFAGTAGAVLCQNPETGAYALMREYRLVEHDPNTFEGALETLLNSADQWKGVLGAMNEEDAELDEDDKTSPPAADESPSGGFIRV
jgi:hypothetical protein